MSNPNRDENTLPLSFGSRSKGKGFLRRRDLQKEENDSRWVECEREKHGPDWEIVEDYVNELSISYAPSFEPNVGGRRSDLLGKMPSSGLVIHGIFPSVLVSIENMTTGEKKALRVKKVNPGIAYNDHDELPNELRMPPGMMTLDVSSEVDRCWFQLRNDIEKSRFFDNIWYKHASVQRFRGNYFEETLRVSRGIISEDGLTRFLEDKTYKLNTVYTCIQLFNDLTEYFGVPVKIVFGTFDGIKTWHAVSILYTEDLGNRIPYPSLPKYERFGSYIYESLGRHEQCALKSKYEQQGLQRQPKRQREISPWHLRERNFHNPTIFFDIQISGNSAGQIHIELFADIVPDVVEEFRQFCCMDREGIRVGYEGSPFHRVITGFMVHAGSFVQVDDIHVDDSSSSSSTYGRLEDFVATHSGPGLLSLLSLADNVANANGCQFFITCAECPWFDYEHVVIGRVVDGFDILERIGRLDVGPDDCPRQACVIAGCGLVVVDS